MRTLCLGDARVDLVAEPGGDRFAPRLGGAAARVAAGAAAGGAAVALAATAGDDPWGRWVRRAARAAGADVTWLALAAGRVTPVGFEAGERWVVGEPLAPDPPAAALEACDALLVDAAVADPPQAEGRPLVLLAALGGRRAVDVRGHVRAAFLVVCDREDAFALTGEAAPAAAAAGLVAGGARHAVVCGPDGAALRGERGLRLDARGRFEAITAAGALVAALGRTDLYAPALAAALPAAAIA